MSDHRELLKMQIAASLARESFHDFFKYFAWPVLQPGTPFKDNWHVHVICEHLEAVKAGQIKKLVINMPFRMLKSSLVSQAFPAWMWVDLPSTQFLTASYAKAVSTRDAVDSRRIIESPAYQQWFGESFQMTSDQNVKTFYENDKRGMRIITSTDGAATGLGGNGKIIDDPVSAKEADSVLALATSIEWWKGTMATRANDPETDWTILVHQRVNANDLTGYVLENENGWEHLVLPFRFDPELRKTTSLGFVDPRTKEGELIHPARIGEETAKDMEKTLGAYHVQAQLQQNPAPRGGIIFRRGDWKFYEVLPNLDEVILSVDCTFKDLQTSDYVALQAWGRYGANYYLLKRIKDHLNFTATCAALSSLREWALLKFGDVVAVLVEDKANGTAVIETMSEKIPGIIPITPDGGKVARAYAMQPTQEAGNVFLPDPKIDPEIEVYLTELSAFPGVQHDDETDATTQAINWLRVRNNTEMSTFNFYKQQMEERKAA